jgi:hypothetical protein
MTDEKKLFETIEPGQPWEVFRFQPKDAKGVAELFRVGYGEGYPVRTYIEPSILIQENEALRVISSVAKTPRGEVIGHSSIFNSAPHSGVYESGATLLHPDYRGRLKLFPKLMAHSLDLAKTIPQVEVVFGEPVCKHTTLQKLGIKLGYTPTALEVDLMPADAYEREKEVTGRVATTLAFMTYRPFPHKVYLPEAYREPLQFFYSGVEQDREFLVSNEEVPLPETSDISHQIFEHAGVTRIAVRSVGCDFSERMKSLEGILKDKGVMVFQVWLNLGDRKNEYGVEILRKTGYFLGGILPRWFGTDGLLMQKILKTPDWQGIHVYGEKSEGILERVHADWERSVSKQGCTGSCLESGD